MLKKLIPPLFFSIALTSCATNNVTGRSQLNLVTEERAQSLGRESYAKVISEYQKKGKILTSGVTFNRVTEISNRLIDQAVKIHPESADWEWEVNLIDEDTLNAWCMPGGKMAVYTGIIDKLDLTDDELAAIMGHEISHALGGHGREKMSVQMMSGLAVALIAVAAGKNDPNRQDLYYSVGSTLSAVAVTLPNSREKEYEADRMGIELAARAGFDPAGAANVWIKMGREGSGNGPDFLSTHPSGDNRISELRALEGPMQAFKDAAHADETVQNPPNPWISNSANDYASFSKHSYLASVEKQQLLTYAFGTKNVSGVTANQEDKSITLAVVDVEKSMNSTKESSSGLAEKSVGQKLGTALGVLAGVNPSISQPSALNSGARGQTSEVGSTVDSQQQNENLNLNDSMYKYTGERTSTLEPPNSKKNSVNQSPDALPIKKSNSRRVNLTCEISCKSLTIPNADKLNWAIENKNWLLVEQTISVMNSRSDSSYYWLGVSEWERGNIELAKIYFEHALELNSRVSMSCDKGSSMPCFGVNIKESASKYLKKIELSLRNN